MYVSHDILTHEPGSGSDSGSGEDDGGSGEDDEGSDEGSGEDDEGSGEDVGGSVEDVEGEDAWVVLAGVTVSSPLLSVVTVSVGREVTRAVQAPARKKYKVFMLN